MSANIKWETVQAADLHDGDKVRVTHPSGDVFYGQVKPSYEGDKAIKLDNLLLPDLSLLAVVGRGYTVERAVPERTLPTEAGLYASRIAHVASAYPTVYSRTGNGNWYESDNGSIAKHSDLPADLVRLVPVTEADELRKRIEKVREYVSNPGNWGSADGRRIHITDLLDGEA